MSNLDLAHDHVSARAAPSARAPAYKKARARFMAAVRKTHMYLGLALFPWVVFFGVSGMLFNHPGIGEEVRARPLASEQLRTRGFEPLVPGELASELVAKLRERGFEVRLDESFKSELSGSTAFSAQGNGAKHLVLVSLTQGRGVVLTRPDHTPAPAPFAGTLALASERLEALAPQVDALLRDVGIGDAQSARLSVTPTLRFRLQDARGETWNALYDLGSQRLDARPSKQAPVLSLHDLLGELHKTHHFPPELGPTTFWALFADLTGLTLVLWALTGLVMWWQFKKTRVLGVLAVSLGLFVASWVMLATHEELRFGNVRPSEPGKPAGDASGE